MGEGRRGKEDEDDEEQEEEMSGGGLEVDWRTEGLEEHKTTRRTR